jgi:hypothetical protein
MPVKQQRNRRRASRRAQNVPQHQLVTGSGDFKIPKSVRNAIRTAATSAVARQVVSGAGTAIGARFGQPDLGRTLANKAYTRLVGSGDYDMRANSLITSTAAGPVMPTFAPDGRRGIRIREREYIGDVISGSSLVGASSAFNNTSYIVNPSNPTTFPWLSQFANNFDQWEPHGIVFEYVSTSSNFNGSTQALGVVVTAADYDFADPLYASKSEMENSGYAISTAASASMLHGIECAATERPARVLYTGTGSGSDTSNNLHNLARFQIATQGMSTASVTLGELWVTYDITFYKKQLVPAASLRPYSYFTSTTDLTVGESLLWHFSPVHNDLGIVFDLNEAQLRFAFPPSITSGKFIIAYSFHSDGTTDAATVPLGGSFNVNITFPVEHASTVKSVVTTGGTWWNWCGLFVVTGSNALLDMGPTTALMSGARSINIFQVNDALEVEAA